MAPVTKKIDKQKETLFFIQFYESVLAKLPNDCNVIEQLGHLYTSIGRIDDGLLMDQTLVKLNPTNAIAHYNLACSYALKNETEKALSHLKQAFKLGYDDIDHTHKDSDLKNLHQLPEFKELIKSYKRP